MFNKFAAVLSQAVEALAPTMPLQEDFVFHWKAITHFFIECTDGKIPIESTNIPSHLDQMLSSLLQEEAESETGSTGPCMEYLLQHKLLETLQTLGRADCPPGMKQHVLIFFTKLLSRIKQPLLPHINVYKPVHRLIRLCGEVKAAPTETEEIQFLCTVCSKLKQDSYLVNFFLEPVRTNNSAASSPAKGAVGSADVKPDYTLVSSLITLSHSADSRVAVKACEGLMLCVTLPETNAAKCMVEHTNFCKMMTERLCRLYEAIPKNIDPADLETVEAKWGLDIMCESEDVLTFPGKRHVISFLSWLDYCDQLVKEAHPFIGRSLSKATREGFLVKAVQPAILQPSESECILAIALLTRSLRLVTSDNLLSEFVYFILGEDREPESPGASSHKLKDGIIKRCVHVSDEVSMTALKLLEVLLLKPDEHVVHNLVLSNLLNRSYFDFTSELTNHDEGSDGEDPPLLSPSPKSVDYFDLSPDFIPLKPSSSINKVVNCFLCLVPDEAKSSFGQAEDSGYETYLRDAHTHFSYICYQCSSWRWPQEPLSLVNGCKTDEVDKPELEEFYEGSFLHLLFDKLSRILDQTYEVNLQITSLISKIALFPHPNLHEYLLDPFLPMKLNTRSLYSVLQKVVSDLQPRLNRIPDFRKKLMASRKQLTGEVDSISTVESCNLLEGVIVLEEFCKELAAIACVKHHAIQT